MAFEMNSPLMNLPIPAVGLTIGPQYGVDVNSCLTIIDGHNHAPGSGTQINPDGLDINADLTFQGNNATALRTVRFTPQTSVSGVLDTGCIYALTSLSDGADLYFNDGVHPPIQITKGGAVNATSSGIVSGTNSASFVSNTLVVLQNTGVAGAIDAATYILRYNGSYPSPSGNYIALEAPSSLATGYALTLPAALPANNGSFLTSSTAGVLSYTNADNSTLSITSGVLGVAAGGITTTQIANGAVTTTQIATNTILNGNMAGASVDYRVLAPANAAYSASCGGYSTTSAGPTTPTNMAFALSISGLRQVQLCLEGDGTNSEAYLQAATGGNAFGVLFYMDSGIISNTFICSQGPLYTPNQFSITFPAGALPAGSHTWQAAVFTGGGNVLSVNNCRFVVREL